MPITGLDDGGPARYRPVHRGRLPAPQLTPPPPPPPQVTADEAGVIPPYPAALTSFAAAFRRPGSLPGRPAASRRCPASAGEAAGRQTPAVSTPPPPPEPVTGTSSAAAPARRQQPATGASCSLAPREPAPGMARPCVTGAGMQPAELRPLSQPGPGRAPAARRRRTNPPPPPPSPAHAAQPPRRPPPPGARDWTGRGGRDGGRPGGGDSPQASA